MFSDLSCDTPPCDVPLFAPLPHEDPFAPLDFDDLLDIAREFEFTHTITHIWPCEEINPCPETQLDDILATIIAPDTEAHSLLSSALSLPLEPIHSEEAGSQGSLSVHALPDEHPNISKDLVPPSKDNDGARCEVEYPITSILRGWSPPNGSQFLDLDDHLMLPQSAMDTWFSPWLTPFLASTCTEPTGGTNQSPAAHATGDAPEAKAPPVNIINRAANNPREDPAPYVLPLGQRANPESAQVKPTLPANENAPRQTIATPHSKITKYRIQLPTNPARSGLSAAKYARAPRGGIPPHIARTVTKANFLRVEKERKVIQNAFSSTNVGEGKKPSVFRRVVRAEDLGGESVGEDQLDLRGNNQKKGRAAKRVKV